MFKYKLLALRERGLPDGEVLGFIVHGPIEGCPTPLWYGPGEHVLTLFHLRNGADERIAHEAEIRREEALLIFILLKRLDLLLTIVPVEVSQVVRDAVVATPRLLCPGGKTTIFAPLC